MTPIVTQLVQTAREETNPTITANLDTLEALASFLNRYSDLPYEITLPVSLLERIKRQRYGALAKIRAINARPKNKKKKEPAVNPNYQQKSFEEKFWLGEIGPLTSVAPNLLERIYPNEETSDTVYYTEQKWGEYSAQFIITPSVEKQNGNFIRLTSRGKYLGSYGQNYHELLKHFKESSITPLSEIFTKNFFY